MYDYMNNEWNQLSDAEKEEKEAEFDRCVAAQGQCAQVCESRVYCSCQDSNVLAGTRACRGPHRRPTRRAGAGL